jgi:hypothetical protein
MMIDTTWPRDMEWNEKRVGKQTEKMLQGYVKWWKNNKHNQNRTGSWSRVEGIALYKQSKGCERKAWQEWRRVEEERKRRRKVKKRREWVTDTWRSILIAVDKDTSTNVKCGWSGAVRHSLHDDGISFKQMKPISFAELGYQCPCNWGNWWTWSSFRPGPSIFFCISDRRVGKGDDLTWIHPFDSNEWTASRGNSSTLLHMDRDGRRLFFSGWLWTS